jgi:hypothetical protein
MRFSFPNPDKPEPTDRSLSHREKNGGRHTANITSAAVAVCGYKNRTRINIQN